MKSSSQNLREIEFVENMKVSFRNCREIWKQVSEIVEKGGFFQLVESRIKLWLLIRMAVTISHLPWLKCKVLCLGAIQWLRGPNFDLFWPPPTYSGQTWTFQVPPTFCPRGHFQNLSPLPWKKPILHWVHSNSCYLLKKFQIIRIFILADIKPKGYKHVYKFAVID